jgi:hypothetical protein
MPFNLGLLSDAALTGLSDEEKSSLQKQATQQFLLGSLLSNDASMGLKSALSVPEQYLSGQKAITEMQQKAADRAAVANFQGKYMPTQFNEASPEYRGPVTPDIAMQQNELKTARAQGLPFNIQNALQDVINLPSASQSSMLGAITSLQPKMQPSGILTNANMQPIGGLPSFDARSGLVSRPTVQGGNVDFNISAAPGFSKATALNTLPELQKGEQYAFDNNQNVIGIVNANGTLEALAARTRTETAAREANIPRPSTTATGAPSFTFVTPPAMQGQGGTVTQPVTGPSTAQATLNAAFKPILDDAYKGYQTAKKTAPVIDQLQNAYNQPGFDTGSFTNVRTQLGNVFNSLGVSGERNKQFLTNAISARQGINALTGESLSEAVGAISNFEIGYYGQRNAQITDPKESTNFNLAVLREANKRKQDYYNFVADPKNAGPDVLAKWEASPQGQKQMFESPGLRKYLPQLQVTSGPDKGKTAYQLPSGVYRVYD